MESNSREKKHLTTIEIPFIPKSKNPQAKGIGDIIKDHLKKIGLDKDCYKWVPGDCEKRRKALNRFQIRI